MPDQSLSAQHFLDLIKRSRRGKFKVYVGMSAGVGKSYRMLQEAHSLLRNGVNVKIGFIETHGRVETEALVAGLPMIPRRKLFYKSRELEEMDVLAVVLARPEVVIVDELAHTNLPGSTHEKRWEDVLEILEAGISVISAVNIQHLESLNDEVRAITGIEVTERVPDHVLRQADEVQTALANFFQPDKILQLRELALKEVAAQVVRKIDTELPADSRHKPERFLACVSSNDKTARAVIRKTARLASYYSSDWLVLYVQTPREAADRIPLAAQRHLINNFKLGTQLGAEVVQVQARNVPQAILDVATQWQVTTVCIGKPHFSLLRIILNTWIFNELLNRLSESEEDLIVLS